MADRKISELSSLAAGSQATGDLLTIVDVSEGAATDKNKKITVESLFKGIPGDVGIGTSSPGSILHTAANDPEIRIQDLSSSSANSSDAKVAFYHLGGSKTAEIGFTATGNSASLKFRSTVSTGLTLGTNSTDALHIDSSQRVGIGNSNPGDYSSVSEDLVVGNHSGAHGITIAAQSNNTGYLSWADGTGTTAEQKAGRISYSHADNSMRFLTNASERMRINSSGNVGVGTTDASSLFSSNRNVRLSNTSGKVSYEAIVLDSSNNNRVGLFVDQATGDLGLESGSASGNYNGLSFSIEGSKKATIDRGGRLLVGTSSARDNYFTSASGQALQFQIEGTDYKNSCASFTSNSTSAGFGPHLAFGRSRGTAIGSNTLINNGDTLGVIVFHGNDGSKFVQCARIDALVDGTPGTNDMPGRLVFSTTADGASLPSERLRIDSSGNVGIGTTSPSFSNGSGIELQRDGTACLRIHDNTNSKAGEIYADSSGLVLDARGSSAVTTFDIGGSEKMRLDNSGRLLVGTTTEGDVNADNLTVADSGNCGMTLRSGSSSVASIYFSDATSGAGEYAGYFQYVHSSNYLNIGVNGADAMRIDSSGRLLFGQSTTETPGFGNTTTGISMLPDGRIFSSMGSTFSQFNRNSDGGVLNFARSSTGVGVISVTTTSTSYGTSSDYRLKENVVALDGAIARVKQLLPKRFNFIVDADTTVDGFLAHEAQTVVPEAVTGTHDEVDDDSNPVYQCIDQSKLVPLLTAALQEAIAKIETLETKVAALEAQ